MSRELLSQGVAACLPVQSQVDRGGFGETDFKMSKYSNESKIRNRKMTDLRAGEDT